MTWFRTFTQRWLAGLAALVLMLLTPASVLAHADYERSEPAADAVVTIAPTQLQIWFTQDLFRRQGMNRIEVYDAAEQRIDQDDPTIDDDNRRLMTVSLQPELADGVYIVRWYSLSSEDGHEGEGEFRFTVDSTGTISATGQVMTTGAVTATDEVTTTDEVSPTDELSPTETVSATVSATVAPTVAAEPTSQSPALPCLGGAAPLALILGSILVRRRRFKW